MGAYCFTSVRLSVCLLKTSPVNLTFSYNFHAIQVTMLIFGMKTHLINTHLLLSRSRSSAEVKVEYQSYISQKMVVSEALMFHKHILVFFFFFFFRIMPFFLYPISSTRMQCSCLLFHQHFQKPSFSGSLKSR